MVKKLSYKTSSFVQSWLKDLQRVELFCIL